MKTTMTVTLSFLALALSMLCGARPAFAEAPEDRDIYGIWAMNRGQVTPVELKKKSPWVKGAFITLKWDKLEPSDGKFDWQYFDESVDRDARAGLYIVFLVWAGPASPDWLTQAGVPEVTTSGKGRPSPKPHDKFPYYLDSKYTEYYQRMIRAVAAHVDTLPPEVRKMIVCIQSAEGSTGDQGAYKGHPLDSKYDISAPQWSAFKQQAWTLLDELYRDKKPAIHVLINVGTRDDMNEGDSGWLTEHLPNVWRKATGPCQMYQMPDELTRFEKCNPLFNELDANGNVRTRCRGELSLAHQPWFTEAPVWNMYWLSLWNVHFGVDMFMQQGAVIDDAKNAPGFVFFSKYAGRKDPATSPGAWCALRDGLDVTDTQRFPVSRFGGLGVAPETKAAATQPTNVWADRALKIVKAFAAQGAVQGDPAHTSDKNSVVALNDAGYNIWRGNYDRYLVQYDPNGTSQGFWRVGPKDQPYGRFARGFDTQAGKNTMYFDIVDRFFHDKPLNAEYPVNVRVVYFDKGTGKWELQYDAVSGNKTALDIQKTDSGRWKEVTVEIKDGYFGNRCPNKTDLMLVNTGKEDTIFHMIEVTRALPG
jgi:hypothetical protein